MKKLISILAALVLLGGIAVSESIDYASLTDDQLHEIINLARNELAKRELIAQEKTVLFEQDGVQLYLTGKYRVSSKADYMYLEAVVVNDSDLSVGVALDSYKASVNGWDVWGDGISGTKPGKKQKGEITIKIADAEISTYEELEEIEFVFKLFNGETYKTISLTDPITVHFNQ